MAASASVDDADRGLRVEGVLEGDADRGPGDPDVAARVDRAAAVAGVDEQLGDEVDELPLARGADVEHARAGPGSPTVPSRCSAVTGGARR